MEFIKNSTGILFPHSASTYGFLSTVNVLQARSCQLSVYLFTHSYISCLSDRAEVFTIFAKLTWISKDFIMGKQNRRHCF